MHWSEDYIGRPYVSREYDCASLVVEVQRDVFGREVPDYGERPAFRSEQFDLLFDEIEELTERVEKPEEGCAVQIITAGRLAHVGVYCEIRGEGHVLHNIKRHGVVLTRMRDLARHGWTVEGFYRWK